MPVPVFYMTLCFVNGHYDPYTRIHESYEGALEFCTKQLQKNSVSSCVVMKSIQEVTRTENPVTVVDIADE